MIELLEKLLCLLEHGFRFIVDVQVLSPFPLSVPPASQVIGIKFSIGDDGFMNGTIVLQPIDPSFAVTSRPCTVVLNGGPPINLDMQDPTVTFPVNPGDTGVATALGAINAQGQGPASAPFSFTVPAAGGGVPPAEVITGVTFA